MLTLFFWALLVATAALVNPLAAVSAESYRLAEWPVGAGLPEFHLTDMNGHLRGINDYAGTVKIVYFGYTHCPDICPAELLELSQVVSKLGPSGSNVRVLFVSLDPERDTPDLLKEYVSSFDPRFVGLTGTIAEVNSAAASFLVRFAKVPLGGADYTIDHSTGVYVLDQVGRPRLVGTAQTSTDVWVNDLRNLMSESLMDGGGRSH